MNNDKEIIILKNNTLKSGKKFFLIVLEGLDCCGKSTLSQILNRKLLPSIIIAFPDRKTATGLLIDKFLQKDVHITAEELHLLFSANRYEKKGLIEMALKESHVICDRYSLSGVIYSAAKGLDYNWCKNVESLLPKADFTFFINVNVEETSRRRNFGAEAHDRIDFQEKIFDLYHEKKYSENLILIDAALSPEEMADFIIEHISNSIN